MTNAARTAYVVGLPAVLTVHDDGSIEYVVDTVETSASLWEDEAHVGQFGVSQVERDVIFVDAHYNRRLAVS